MAQRWQTFPKELPLLLPQLPAASLLNGDKKKARGTFLHRRGSSAFHSAKPLLSPQGDMSWLSQHLVPEWASLLNTHAAPPAALGQTFSLSYGALLSRMPPLPSEADVLCPPRPLGRGTEPRGAPRWPLQRVGRWCVGRQCHHHPQHTLCIPSPGLCSANKAPADKLEEALVSDEGNPKDGNTTTLTTAHCSAFPAGQPSLPRDRAGVFQQSILLHTHSDHRAVAGSGACPGECE